MKHKINHYLEELEQSRNIKILLACETGSRAWGFPSPDSDYDVRIIYVHKTDWYLSVGQSRDTIEMMLENNELDISGWELKKSLELLKKSNPALLERIQSPIVYKADADFLRDIQALATSCYSKIATMHHYLSLAKKMNAIISETEEYSLKKLFYALRTAVLCKWILVKEEIPPIEFHKALEGLEIPAGLLNRINHLIELKSTRPESYLHTGESEIKEFINNSIFESEQIKTGLPVGNCKKDELNSVLRKYIHRYDH
ncbi:MAG: nucleotidyltransferase domain-containing protein [Lewinellaceae bacterium]|nr:nucleotidyltransferase domain-containing protein [Saprospiraceae bacterium]MCB9344728.1 nucleotidyltransferase domain-containing protein [Lewinellaceae bacterium]